MADRLPLAAGAGLLATGFLGLLRLDATEGTLRAEVVPRTIVWFLIAVSGFIVTVVVLERRQIIRWRWLLLLGLALRLIMAATGPTLSDDVYRYLWEGHLVTEGVSPYSFAIEDPLADAYEIPIRSQVNNPSLASPYLPAAHLAFAATAAVLPAEPWTMQLLMVGFDVITVAMILKLLDLAALPRHRAMLYWLNPLVIVEVAHGAHLDAMIMGLASIAVVLTLRAPPSTTAARWGAPLALAAAILTRPIAVLFLPVLMWRWDWRQRGLHAIAVAVPVLGVGAVSGFGLDGGGTGVFGSAREYARTFRFNSWIYHRLERLTDSVVSTQVLVGLALGAVLVWVALGARTADAPRAVLRWLAVPLIAYALLTPVLHPWYLLPLLALVPFLPPGPTEAPARWWLVTPWLTFGSLAIFSYLTYENPDAFAERDWVRNLQWIPTLALAVLAIHLNRSETWSPRRGSDRGGGLASGDGSDRFRAPAVPRAEPR